MTEILDTKAIMQVIPFLPRFLMLDKAVVGETESTAIKVVSADEDYFCGHFPNMAIMPGVLQVEAICQLGLLTAGHFSTFPLLKSAKRIKFRNPVVPGDCLQIDVAVIEKTENALTLSGSTKVNGTICCQADFVISTELEENDFKPTCLHALHGYEDHEILYDIEAIKNILPHRFPFLLVDRIFKITEKNDLGYVIGLKNITINEPYFQAFRGDRPYVPNGVLMEIAAQMGCIWELCRKKNEGKIGIFISVDNAEFYKPVIPGDQLIVKCEKVQEKSIFGKCLTELKVAGELVAKVDFKFAVQEAE